MNEETYEDKDFDGRRIENGERFLINLYHSESLQLFKEQSVILLIEYFYEKFRYMISHTFVPFNIIQLTLFLGTIVYNESKWSILGGEKSFPEE